MQMIPSFVAAPVLAVAVAASVGCGTSEGAQEPRANPRTTREIDLPGGTRGGHGPRTPFDGSWRLVSGNGPSGTITPPAGSPITLEIDGNDASGTAACNGYQASVEVTPHRFSVRLLSTTLMACAPDAMAAQNAYHVAIQTIDSATRRGDRLILTNESTELRFAPG